jgi:hypothetical protein
MDAQEKLADLEVLSRMAARLAGRDPDRHLTIKISDAFAFDDVMWRYPDFLLRAQAAYDMLRSGTLSTTIAGLPF